MKQFITLFLVGMVFPCFGQLWSGNSQNISVPTFRRGVAGVNFTSQNALLNRAPFSTQPGVVAFRRNFYTIQDGRAGRFEGNDQWIGIGEGNFAAPIQFRPYGISIVQDRSLAFLNLLDNEPNVGIGTQDLILGFGINKEGLPNPNKFIIKSFSNAIPDAVTKDILIANPRGAVGINNDPFAALSVDTRRSTGSQILPENDDTPEVNGPLFDAIAIQNEQDAGGFGLISSASAMGKQATASLFAAKTAVEGTRAQIPSFDEGIANFISGQQTGVAVNLHVVRTPFGQPVVPNVFTSQNPPPFEQEYAELVWQDLDIENESTSDCGGPIKEANKFFISFRNNQTGSQGGNTNSFSPQNKRAVATFTANGRVGINTTNPTCEISNRPVFLDVQGWANFSGGIFQGSDERYKKDISKIDDAMNLIRQISGKKYYFDNEKFPQKHFGDDMQYGFIAQELEEVIPEMTGQDEEGYYGVNYTMLIPVLTEALKEQDKTIEAMQTQIDELTELMVARESSDFNGYDLRQNRPNPFSNSTSIDYLVPDGYTTASINVYDLTGKRLNSIAIYDAKGTVTIEAGNLVDGMYIYDLVVDGVQVSSKKLLLARD